MSEWIPDQPRANSIAPAKNAFGNHLRSGGSLIVSTAGRGFCETLGFDSSAGFGVNSVFPIGNPRIKTANSSRTISRSIAFRFVAHPSDIAQKHTLFILR